MRRSMRTLPVYSGDVSGVASALFELGGMVVIHDPSGCNSTYNTHDETRWYDRDSLIFITGLTERQAILGRDDKLVNDVVESALTFNPRFIALASSPIPFIAGTDFCALARIIEDRTHIPCFFVPTNGMHDYVVGASNAFLEIAKRFLEPQAKRPHALNVFGLTPLDFACGIKDEGVRAFVTGAGYEIVSSWAMGSSVDDLSQAAAAEVSIVVSATGLAAATELERRFGVPYVVGTPVAGFEDTLAAALERAIRTQTSINAANDARTNVGNHIAVVGEPVWATSLAAALEGEGADAVQVVSTVEAPRDLIRDTDISADGEEEVEEALANAHVVHADPLYRSVIPPQAELVAHPHFAFSGRYALTVERQMAGH